MSKTFSMTLRKQHHDYEFVDLTAQVVNEKGEVLWSYKGRHHRETEYSDGDYRAIMNVMVNNAIASGAGDRTLTKARIDTVSLTL